MDNEDIDFENVKGLFIDLNISIDKLELLNKLHKEVDKFRNGLLIFDLIGFEIFPIIYRKKIISAYDLPEIILTLNENLKKQNLEKKTSITGIDSYLLLNNNLLIFRLS
jgi:hypothetical protein